MRLSELLAGAGLTAPRWIGGPDDPQVARVVGDSRAVEPGDLFVARPGFRADGGRTDGARFAREAAARGAVAVVAEAPSEGDLGVPVVVVDDASAALGRLCARRLGDPSRDVAVVGVTGTNGKTTTAFLTHWLLEASGRPASLLGTVCNRVGGRVTPATMTTPGAEPLQAALAATRDAGHRHLVMEVSSHALDQGRTAGTRFACAVFTNLTRDHLDYHGSLEAYGEAKARLFTGLDADAVAVLNAGDAFARGLARRTRARVVRYAWSAPGAPAPGGDVDVAAEVLGWGLEGTRARLRLGGWSGPAHLPLVGAFNVENALAAAAAAWALGLAPEQVRAGLEASQGVPGRLEAVGDGGGRAPAVLVDYAHTPDALERVLEALRPLCPGRLHVVFGCGGDRDRGKRPLMGRAVERWADVAWVTSDNPRSEPPAAIIADVLGGLAAPERARVVAEREAAIAAAVREARPGDLVLLAGKGHEQTQVAAGRVVPFDDRAVARAALARRAA